MGYNKKGNVQNVYGNEACPSGKKNPDWIVGNDSKQDGSVWAESLGLLLSLDEMKSGAVTVPSSGQECASFTEALNAGARNLCVDAGRDASGQTDDGRPQMGGFGHLSSTGIIRISAEGRAPRQAFRLLSNLKKND